MEIVQILRRLWELRLWLAIAAVVAACAGLVSVYNVSSSGLEKKSIEYGAASTQILIDSSRSSLADINQDLVPLVIRADAYARLLASPTVKRSLAQAAGVPLDQLAAEGPPLTSSQATRSEREPSGEQRSTDLIAEGLGYNIRFDSPPDLPVVQVFTQAPTAEQAIRLADAAPTALAQYVTSVGEKQKVGNRAQVKITPLGPASGGIVNEGTSLVVALLTGIAVWVGLAVLILLLSNVVRQFRQARALERIGAAPWSAEDMHPGTNGNGAGPHGEDSDFGEGPRTPVPSSSSS